MAVDEIFRIEVETIYQVFDGFGYYQVLKIDRSASQLEVQEAFRKESRLFHPDRYFAVDDEEFKGMVRDIYKRIAEAYAVLKEPELRQIYDAQLDRGGPVRLDRQAMEAAQRGSSPSSSATTFKGRKFLQIALSAMKKKDYESAVMNLQFALSEEPDNESLQELLESARESSSEGKRQSGAHRYKVRFN